MLLTKGQPAISLFARPLGKMHVHILKLPQYVSVIYNNVTGIMEARNASCTGACPDNG
jgi:hypothetical protein